MKLKKVAFIVVAVGATAGLVYIGSRLLRPTPIPSRQTPPAPDPGASGALGFNIGTLNALANNAQSLFKTFGGTGAPKPTTPAEVASAGSGFWM